MLQTALCISTFTLQLPPLMANYPEEPDIPVQEKTTTRSLPIFVGIGQYL